MLFGASSGVRPRVLALALLAVPAFASAQARPGEEGARPRTHTVKRGDTLWDLAQTYLNDPFQWPEIYRLNREVVENPHWIYPGEVLTLPGATVAATEPEPRPEPAPVVEAPRPSDGRTAFTRTDQVVPPSRPMSGSLTEPGPAVRPGEILAAPWVDVEGGPAGTGRVLEYAELRRGDRSGIYRGQMQLYEETLVVLPAGVSSAVGTRLLVFEPGELIRRDRNQPTRQIMYPLGVMEVTRTPAPGEAAIARVVRLFSMVRPGARLMAFDSATVRAGGDPTIALGDAGPVTTVRWVWRDQPLPSLQSYVLLDAGARDGVHVGDRYTIFRARTPATDEGDPDAPALDAATAQVVRVTPLGSTAMILGHRRPQVEAGMPARATARVP